MNKQSRFLTLALMVLSAAVMRLLPHPWNFTPIAAMALFSGTYFDRPWTAFLIPLGALLLSDFVLGFHNTMLFVYGAFAVTVLLGRAMRQHRTWGTVVRSSLFGSVVFFVITNLGVWLVGGLYAQTLSGLMQCFVAAIPFFRTSLIGDLVYTTLLFGAFSWAERRFFVLKSQPISA